MRLLFPFFQSGALIFLNNLMLGYYDKKLFENMKDHSLRAVHEYKLKPLHYANEIEILTI